MGKGSNPPPEPDPNQVAQAQAGYDKGTAAYNAALNRYNVQTPFGSLDWTQSGVDPSTGAPMYAQKVNLTPNSQATLDQSQSNALGLAKTQGNLLSTATNMMASPMDYSHVPGLSQVPGIALNAGFNGPGYAQFVNAHGPGFATGVNDRGPGYAQGVADRGPGYAQSVADRGPGYAGAVAQGDLTGLANKATKASYDSSMALLQPQMDISRKSQIQDLANRGIPMGSEGYNNALGSMDREQDFTRAQAANNATLQGMQYDNQLFNQGQQNANLQNQAQQGIFSQGLNNANLQDMAQQGMFAQGTTNANFQNQAQQGLFGQGVTNAGLQNAAEQGVFGEGTTNAGLQNNAQLSGFNQNLANANLNNSAQATAMQQMLALRNQPLNEYNAMIQGSQVQTPQFQQTPSVMANTPNYQQAVQNQYQGQLNAYNAQTGANNSFMSGLFGLGGAALGAPATSVFGKLFG